jgi:DNA-binding transcriptional LysR family regulator|tara:strand:- start:32065 stop:32964 length:900 start_codon:yes stop_codon:yes gene_type:complete
MNLKQLQYFRVLAEELHFRRAAEKLNITQAPLSVAIQNLEKELGAQLFIRNQRKVVLSEVGIALREHAENILENLERCKEDIQAITAGAAGRLRIGFTSASSLLSPFPSLIHAFRTRYPEVLVTLQDLTTLAQIAALENNEIDAGVIRRPQTRLSSAISLRKLTTDRLVIAMHSSHELLEREQLWIADLKGQDFIFFPRQLGVGIYDQFITLCAQRGFIPTIVQEAKEATTIVGLVATGLGIAIVPSGLSYINIPNVVYRPLADDDAETDLLLAFRAGEENPRIARLIHLAQQAFAQER